MTNYDYGIKLAATAPCRSRGVGFCANVYVTTPGRGAASRQLALPDKVLEPELLQHYTIPTIGRLDRSERNKVIAINFFKLCNAKQHDTFQLERVGAIAFGVEESTPIPLVPHSLRTTDGVGTARSALPTNMLLDPVIDFATLDTERFTHPPTEAIEAAVSRPGNRAYIAIRGLERVMAVR